MNREKIKIEEILSKTGNPDGMLSLDKSKFKRSIVISYRTGGIRIEPIPDDLYEEWLTWDDVAQTYIWEELEKRISEKFSSSQNGINVIVTA